MNFKDLENTTPVEVSAAQLRSYFRGAALPENMQAALDKALGDCNEGAETVWIVIRVER